LAFVGGVARVPGLGVDRTVLAASVARAVDVQNVSVEELAGQDRTGL
jgi:hypothetical protein